MRAPLLLPVILLTAVLCLRASPLCAKIHAAPVIIPATSLPSLQFTSLDKIRLFRSGAKGQAEAIAFQIDEKDKYSDFILPLGRLPNQNASNGTFDGEDELSFMGMDVGPAEVPRSWPGGRKPERIVEIKYRLDKDEGAVYAGVFERSPPPPAAATYVKFSLEKSEVVTSKYSYQFNPKNYLVVRGVEINQQKAHYPLLDSSTFFLRADLKYLLSVSINHQSIKSVLEAYKVGPIRAIVRVNFDYTLGPVNLELGMYTEVSFFANSVLLPAIIENPLNSKKILNPGSLFYYGFSLVDNPQKLALQANLPTFGEGKNPFSEIDPALFSKDGRFWISATHSQFMFFLEMITSPEMQADKNIPAYYTENHPGAELKSRAQTAAPLGKSPVNVALALNLANLREGVHKMSLRLFIENKNDHATLAGFTSLDKWLLSERLVIK